MAIHGITDVYQQQRQLPKLRLGFMDENANNKRFPKNPDHFCFDPDEVPEVVAVYGEQPKEIHAMLVGNNIDEIMPSNYQFFTSGGSGSWFLNCSGDGKTAAWYARHLKKTPNIDINKLGFHDGKEKPNSFLRTSCGEGCPDYISGKCKPTARIRVMLPRVSTSTVYEIVTHAESTMKDFTASVQNAQKDFSFGNGMGVVFVLFKKEIKKQKVKKDETGTEAHQFKYLTCQKDDGFWEKYKEEFIANIRKSSGVAVRQQLMSEYQIDTAQIASGLRNQVQASDALQQLPPPPPEHVNTETGEIIDVKPSTKPTGNSLENDPEVIAKVQACYKGQMPNDAVKKAIAKYGTKKALISGIDVFLAKTKSPTAPPLTAETPRQEKNVTPTVNDSLL